MIYWRQVEKPGLVVERELITGVTEHRKRTGRLGCECHVSGMTGRMAVYQEVEETLTIGSEFRQRTFPERISTIQCFSPGDPEVTVYDLLISRECQWVALDWIVGEALAAATHNILWWAVQQKDAHWNADLKHHFPDWFAGFHPGVIGSSVEDVSREDEE